MTQKSLSVNVQYPTGRHIIYLATVWIAYPGFITDLAPFLALVATLRHPNYYLFHVHPSDLLESDVLYLVRHILDVDIPMQSWETSQAD